MPAQEKNESAGESSVGPVEDGHGRPSRREIFEASLSGAREQDELRIPLLRSDVQHYERLAHSLAEFRMQEGDKREERLRRLWRRLPQFETVADGETVLKDGDENDASFSREKARELNKVYQSELVGRCRDSEKPHAGSSSSVSWNQFYKYAEAKEVELWHIFHSELDLDGNGHLDADELGLALRKAGISLSASTMSEFMTTLTASPHSHAISFREFRDFLLLMPRKASTAEIYQYYKMTRYLGDDGRGAARVTMEGDVSLSAEDKPSLPKPTVDFSSDSTPAPAAPLPVDHLILDPDDEHHHNEQPERSGLEEHHNWLLGSHAAKYLLAGGVAGAVSRTCTAPFDRLKIFLITRKPDVNASVQIQNLGTKAITNAIKKIYLENGVLGFWIGNGLATAKILPESAIKFLSYETSKRFFARYWDHVEDPREISQMSRFFAGGIGGITSQLSIYPIETVKTQMMSNIGSRLTVMSTIKHVYSLGGTRAFYRGLTIGLIGVFPYSAIDMSTFEALKIAYVKSTGKDEPGVLAILAFGSISGSVGATSVYPLNMTRTRLQASGSPGHPQRYTGIWDVAFQTYKQNGIRGFYTGLGPTLAKVIPAVSISYVVYEHSKRRLGV